MVRISILISVLVLGFSLSAGAETPPRPRILVSALEVGEMRSEWNSYPLFRTEFDETKNTIDGALLKPIDVPIPIDAGGYTHERHKQNYREMQAAGLLYQITRDERYAQFVRDMLLKYAKLYPSLKPHPKALNSKGGRLFWQTLNETVWLVHASQAYDCIYDWLKPSERKTIEEKVFRPMVRFFLTEQKAAVDRVHNHGTWMSAALGMIGYAMNDRDLVDVALYGTKRDGSAGFLKQLDQLFSPDGYYAEGPYYARYAIMPFFFFAQAIEYNQPELRIFEHRNQILRKAVWATLQLTNPDGTFLPINDALKEMSLHAKELILAVDICLARYPGDDGLLWFAKRQNSVTFDGAGLKAAKILAHTRGQIPNAYRSLEFRDGSSGNEGGVGVLRSIGEHGHTLLAMKYTAQGDGHGHYDKLSFIYGNQDREIVQDYGAVRFVNVEPKFGGRYLPETDTWAKQTIAHNTIVVDGRSHYDGMFEVASEKHADRHFFSASDPSLQVMSAKAEWLYDGVSMQRTMALVQDDRLAQPLVLDLFKIESKDRHQYDLPFYYLGHLMHTNVNYRSFDTLQTRFGSSHGYQHLWKEAEGVAGNTLTFTWLNGHRYYSIVSAAGSPTSAYLVRIGAGDLQFNLRNEPALILRRKTSSTLFASAIEAHGYFEGVNEISYGTQSTIQEVNVLASNSDVSLVEYKGKDSLRWVFAVTHRAASDTQEHSITVGTTTYAWRGNFRLWRE